MLFHGLGRADAAAGGAFLDALARWRHTAELPATCLHYGPWDVDPMVDAPYRDRMSRLGITILFGDEGLELFDAALAHADAASALVRVDRRTLLGLSADLPAVLRGLVRTSERRSTGARSAVDLRQRLAGLPDGERDTLLLDLVTAQVAGVLGHTSAEAVEPDRAFQELGFDSLAAVELRRRLSAATALALPATLVFDHPTSRAVADYLAAALVPAREDVVQTLLGEFDRLESALAAFAPDDAERGLVMARMEAMLRNWRDAETDSGGAETGPGIEAATDDELFEVLDRELGKA
jgi:acyl carrier protein